MQMKISKGFNFYLAMAIIFGLLVAGIEKASKLEVKAYSDQRLEKMK